MKLNQTLPRFTLTVSAALTALLLAPALCPKFEERFMKWAVPGDGALQGNAAVLSSRADDPVRDGTSIAHLAIAGVLDPLASAREELPRGPSWPRVTPFDREFSALVATLRKCSCRARERRSVWRATGDFLSPWGSPSERVRAENVLDPECGEISLALDWRLEEKRGMVFQGGESTGSYQSQEGRGALIERLLAAMITGTDVDAPSSAFDFNLVPISRNTAVLDGGSRVGSDFSTANRMTPGVSPPFALAANALQRQGWSDLVPAAPPVSGSNAPWNGMSAPGSLFATLPPILNPSAPSPLAANRSSVTDRGIFRGGYGIPAAPLRTPGPEVLSSSVPVVSAPAGGSTIVLHGSTGGGSGTSTVPVIAITHGDSIPPVHAIAPPAGLTITPTFDSSITGLANAAAVETAINAAIAQVRSTITTPYPDAVTIEFMNSNSDLGSNISPTANINYSAYLAALKADPNLSALQTAAFATMPAGPTVNINGNNYTQVTLTAANLAAINMASLANSLISGNGGFDGVVSINTATTNPSRTSGQVVGNYDLQSTAEHEIDEVLGIGGYGSTLIGPALPTTLGPLDFFRYSAPGIRSFNGNSSATAYFSIDGGTTNLVGFNQDSEGDYGDWYSVNGGQVPEVQDAFATPYAIGDPAPPDLDVNETDAFQVVGYNLLAVPEPRSVALLASSAVTLLGIRRRRSHVAV